MEANINGREAYLNRSMEDLKKDVEGLKESGTKIIQERPLNEENVVEDTHDEKKKMLIMIS